MFAWGFRPNFELGLASRTGCSRLWDDRRRAVGPRRLGGEWRLGEASVHLVISSCERKFRSPRHVGRLRLYGDSVDNWANASRNFQARSTTPRLGTGSHHKSALPWSVCFEVGIDCRTFLARSTTSRFRAGSHHASALPWSVRFEVGIDCRTFQARSTTPRLRAGSYDASTLPCLIWFEVGIDCRTFFIKTPFEEPEQEDHTEYHENTESNGDSQSKMVWERLVSDIIRRN